MHKAETIRNNNAGITLKLGSLSDKGSHPFYVELEEKDQKHIFWLTLREMQELERIIHRLLELYTTSLILKE